VLLHQFVFLTFFFFASLPCFPIPGPNLVFSFPSLIGESFPLGRNCVPLAVRCFYSRAMALSSAPKDSDPEPLSLLDTGCSHRGIVLYLFRFLPGAFLYPSLLVIKPVLPVRPTLARLAGLGRGPLSEVSVHFSPVLPHLPLSRVLLRSWFSLISAYPFYCSREEIDFFCPVSLFPLRSKIVWPFPSSRVHPLFFPYDCANGVVLFASPPVTPPVRVLSDFFFVQAKLAACFLWATFSCAFSSRFLSLSH